MTLAKAVDRANGAQIPTKYLGAEFSANAVLPAVFAQRLTAKQMDKMLSIQSDVYDFAEQAHRFINKDLALHEEQWTGVKIFLTLMGAVGTGKTYLAVAALKRLIFHHGHCGRFVDFQMLLSCLREAYAQKNSEYQILKPFLETDVLVLDEFGKLRTENEWQLEKLDNIINSRYNNNKITILTTNYLPPQLQYNVLEVGLNQPPVNESFWVQSLPDRIGQRMYDRILENSYFVDFIGLPSLRHLQAQNFLQRYTTALEAL